MSILGSARAALARVTGLLGGSTPDADDDLREELQAHLDMETTENIRRGMHPDAAARFESCRELLFGARTAILEG